MYGGLWVPQVGRWITFLWRDHNQDGSAGRKGFIFPGRNTLWLVLQNWHLRLLVMISQSSEPQCQTTDWLITITKEWEEIWLVQSQINLQMHFFPNIMTVGSVSFYWKCFHAATEHNIHEHLAFVVKTTIFLLLINRKKGQLECWQGKKCRQPECIWHETSNWWA